MTAWLLVGLAMADVAVPQAPYRMTDDERAAAIAAEDAALAQAERSSPWGAVGAVGGGVALLAVAGVVARSRRRPR